MLVHYVELNIVHVVQQLDGFGQRRDAGGISPCLLCHRVFEAVQAAETVSGLCLAGKAVAVP